MGEAEGARIVIFDYDETITYTAVMRGAVHNLALLKHSSEAEAQRVLAEFTDCAKRGDYSGLANVTLEAARGLKKEDVDGILEKHAELIAEKGHRPNAVKALNILRQHRDVYIATVNFKQLVVESLAFPPEKVIGSEFEYDADNCVCGLKLLAAEGKAKRIIELLGENGKADFVMDGKHDMYTAKEIEARGGRTFAFYPIQSIPVGFFLDGRLIKEERPIKPRKASFTIFTDDMLVTLGLLDQKEFGLLPRKLREHVEKLLEDVYTRESKALFGKESGKLAKLAGMKVKHISEIPIGEYHQRIIDGRAEAKTKVLK